MSHYNMHILFTPVPDQWGSRGDPYLWNEFEEISKLLLLPETENDLNDILLALYKNLTGKCLEKGETIFVDRFDTGGMSSGIVCSDFWIENAFPLLQKRLLENKLTEKISKNTVENLLQRGKLTLEEIAEDCSVSVFFVKKIQNQLNKK